MKNLLLGIFSFFTLTASANNIKVNNTSLSNQNTSTHSILINFDVSWENSWRTSNNESNYDGAWIFAKWRKGNTTEWQHCTLSQSNTTAAAGSILSVTNDLVGAFIHRSADGIGSVNFTSNRIQWDYGTDGVLDNESVEVVVFALEMVYIPQGEFYVGSGGTELYSFIEGGTTNPFLIKDNNQISVGNNAGSLFTIGAVSGRPSNAGIPKDFPKGFNAFWCMKYEITQQQYVDFLNHLDKARADLLTSLMSGITGSHPDFMATQPERALGAFNVPRFVALADWSGLRPITELEFEKICRGYNVQPLPNEYVWGTTAVTPITSVTNQGAEDEAVATPVNANATVGGSYSTYTRVGIFARPSGSTRELSGAAYYGVMNMGDNMAEIVAGTGSNLNLTENEHGDGHLQQNATSDIAAFTSQSYILRGADRAINPNYARTSDRGRASTALGNAQVGDNGGRFGRTAE